MAIAPLMKILVVDDDQEICEYMRTFLGGEGYDVHTSCEPQTVVEEIQNGGYHLLILDLMMPRLDGLELLSRVRKVDSDVAIVIVTGYPSLDTAVASMKLDAIDYIRKPFSVVEFRQVLDRVMRKKGLSRTPEEQLHRAIGDAVRHHRRERGLTLKDLSRRTGLSVSLLSQIERAESSPSIASLFRLANALDVRLRDIFAEF